MKLMRLLFVSIAALLAMTGCAGKDDAGTGAGPQVVLVTGATGTQGGAVARELLERGFAVRALTRSPDKPAAQALAGQGAEVVAGNYDDADSINAALDGVHGLFLLTDWWEHGVAREVEHGKRLVDAAVEAQVQHVVFTSVANADRGTGVPHFDSKYEIEQYLRHSGLGYTIIRPVSFMDNWLRRRAEFEAGAISEPYDPATKHQWIAASDIGFFAGEAFSKPDEWLGRAVDIAGDQMSYAELAALLSDILQRPVAYERLRWGEFARNSNEELMAMAQWFDGVGYSVDVAALRSQYPGLITAREFLTGLNWSGEADE